MKVVHLRLGDEEYGKLVVKAGEERRSVAAMGAIMLVEALRVGCVAGLERSRGSLGETVKPERKEEASVPKEVVKVEPKVSLKVPERVGRKAMGSADYYV